MTSTPTTTEAKEEKKKTTQGAMVPLNIHAFEPQNFAELRTLSIDLAKSDIVPKEFIGKPANIMVAVTFGRELGLGWAQALQNIMVVNGRPALWGDAVMGKVKASNVYEASADVFDEKTMTATFTVKRKGEAAVTRTFSQADATKANLWTKPGPWQQYPKRMLFQRARAWALRDAFPDVLKGLRVVEEEMDVVALEKTDDGSWQVPEATPTATNATGTSIETTTNEAETAETRTVELPAETFTVQKVKDGPYKILDRRDNMAYVTEIKDLADYAREAEKAKQALRLEYVPGIGQHEVLQVLRATETAPA